MRWTFAAASVLGTSHARKGHPLQDRSRCVELWGDDTSSALIAVVADGAGSAQFGGEGAAIVCRTFVTAARDAFRRAKTIPSEETVWEWIDQARDRIQASAEKRQVARRQFATTMVALLASADGILTAHIGDGAIVGRDSPSKVWRLLSAPDRGEYASTTYFVTDDPQPKLRLSHHHDVDALAIFSDGIEGLVIDHATAEPLQSFFDPMARPLEQSGRQGHNRILSSALSEFLASDRLNEGTDDDKTLIVAVRA